MHNRTSLFSIIALLALILQAFSPAFTGFAAPAQQTLTPEERAAALLETLKPEERVGQLFLVHFEGTDTGEGSAVYDLVTNHHIGGVVLRADHDNFTGPDGILENTQELVRNLQQIEWLSTQSVLTDTITGETFNPAYIPLFTGISQPGDGPPYDQIYSGLTMLPSPAAIGATWDTALAQRAGLIAGRELSNLGFNLLLGPSLDVLENPNPESGGDLGIRTFGGDPFWVGQMGSAYIEGLHIGSDDRIAVIGKHFPGVGGSDRPIEEEVSTVRKSLEQLKQIELAPFYFVTGDAPTPEATADGLLMSHIRYQGFFGNIRATTRPISFDEASFSEIMNLEPFASWYSDGGVMISDDLGSRAVRRFYDPSGLSFNARLVVRDAFLAGNDILYLGDIIDTGDDTSQTTIVRIVEFFTQKYREDLTFAQRVDESVLRILTHKFSLYDTFSLATVLPRPDALETVGSGQQTGLDIAREGATLISPGFQDLENLVPDAPGLNDRLVFITDTNPYSQCSECPLRDSLDETGLQQAVIRLYGPEAGNQIQRRNLSSYTFENLQALLDGGDGSGLASDMRNAAWIVLAMQDVTASRPESLALRRLLSEQDQLVRGKRLMVFAFNAPYFLDATDISKVTAYYALFTKTPQAVETAARILFKEFVPTFGASPISVTGIGYDLISATSPDPDQIIQIHLRSPVIPADELESTQEPPAPIEIELGEQLVLETGRILDHNGNPIPDGTPVQFVFNMNGVETLSPGVITSGGIARTNFTLSEPGLLRIGLLTEPRAGVAQLEISIPTPADFTTPEPVTATPDEAPTEVVTPTEDLPDEIVPEPPPEPPRTQTDLVDWLIALLVSTSVGLIAYRVGSSAGLTRWSIRWGLAASIGGLLVYLYFAASLAGTEQVVENGRGMLIWLTGTGALLGWAATATWYALYRRFVPYRKTDPPQFPITRKN